MYDSATCGRVAKSQRRLERPAPLQVAALSSAVKSRREITITTGLFKKKIKSARNRIRCAREYIPIT